MFSMKNAALVGLAAADRNLFTPVAQPYAYGQVATAYEPALATAYAADAFAQPEPQFVQYVQPEPQRQDSTWLWAGAGALAVVAAASVAKSSSPSAVAALDEDDLESARIATLGVGGAEKKNPWSLTGFLMSGRKTVNLAKTERKYQGDGGLELLSGATRKPSDDSGVLSDRFKILYDTRIRPKARAGRGQAKAQQKVMTTWRSKNPTKSLYGKGTGFDFGNN
jgi:hypothetical protein